MSNLLINEPAYQVLPSLAEKIGLNEAIVLQQLHFLLIPMRLINGRRWYSCPMSDWAARFKFWSPRTIERVFSSLRNQGLVEATAEFNRKVDDRTLWYTINYAALEELEFDVRGNGSRAAKNAVLEPIRQNGGTVQEQGNPPAKLADSPDPAKMADSFLKEESITTPLQSPLRKPSDVIMEMGLVEAWKDWRDHLDLGKAAQRLTMRQWAAWADEGLSAELRDASAAVIMMGAKAFDPAAVLAGRMAKKRNGRSEELARRAVREEILNEGADQIAEGAQFVTPSGDVATVDYIDSGFVFWREPHLQEAGIQLVLSWERRGGAA